MIAVPEELSVHRSGKRFYVGANLFLSEFHS